MKIDSKQTFEQVVYLEPQVAIDCLHPNYSKFYINDYLPLVTLGAFHGTFHNQLEQIHVRCIFFHFASVMDKIYEIACKNGYVFQLSRFMVSSGTVSAGASREGDGDLKLSEFAQRQLTDKRNKFRVQLFDRSLESTRSGFRSIFERFWRGSNPNSLDVTRIYYSMIEKWIIQLIDNGKLILTPTQNQESLKKVVFDEAYTCDTVYSHFISYFNHLFNYRVFYRILNWKKSVEHLVLQLFGQVKSRHDEHFGWFEKAIDNIFDENNFQKLKQADIQIRLKTNDTNTSVQLHKTDDYDYQEKLESYKRTYTTTTSSPRKLILTAVDFDRVIDEYLKIFMKRVAVNMSKQFQGLNKLKFELKLSFVIASSANFTQENCERLPSETEFDYINAIGKDKWTQSIEQKFKIGSWIIKFSKKVPKNITVFMIN